MTYYSDGIDVTNPKNVESQFMKLLDTDITSVDDLESLIQEEAKLVSHIFEVLNRLAVEFHGNTDDNDIKRRYFYSRSHIIPLMTKYDALFSKKLIDSQFTNQLNDVRYGLMKKHRATRVELYREESLILEVREKELKAKYQSLLGNMTYDPDELDEEVNLDSPHRDVRFLAWTSLANGYQSIKYEADSIMDELVRIRHQIAINAGFENYRDYMLREKNREYSLEQNLQFHATVELYIVPVWDKIAHEFSQSISVDKFRPWDNANCNVSKLPYGDTELLTVGVERMLRETDPHFGDLFSFMLSRGYVDLEPRLGKSPGGFFTSFPVSRHGFIFSNMSPSFDAIITLIHEMGHAANIQYQLDKGPQWRPWRMEVSELFSQGMELLCLDKYNTLYNDDHDSRSAVQQRILRSLALLLIPIAGDAFQHWIYTNPDHSAAERDRAYYEIYKRYIGHPIDDSGYEDEVTSMWISATHIFSHPFYNIEYSIAELGALQLLSNYREDQQKAIESYKAAASTDDSAALISDIYQKAGVKFDFSDETIRQTARFIATLWASNH